MASRRIRVSLLKEQSSAAVLSATPYLGEGPGDLVHVQDDFHQLQVLLIARLINLGFDLRLNNVVHGQAQGDPRQRPGPRRVPVRHGLSIEFRTIGIGSAEDDDEVLLAVLLRDLLDTLLTLQVKGTGRSSDKALCLHEERLGACALKALRNSRPLYPIPFA